MMQKALFFNAADSSLLPKADLILVTHEHGDHMDADVIEIIRTEKTDLVLTQKCMDRVNIQSGIVMKKPSLHHDPGDGG